MSMKKRAGIFALAATMAGLTNDKDNGLNRVVPVRVYKTKDNDKFIEQRNLRRGLKKFTYGQKTLWALNQKNADRKAKNNGWINNWT